MTDESKKAIDLAADIVKQFITLASGIVALTIAFNKDFVGSPGKAKTILMLAWVSYLCSILAGLATLQQLLTPLAQGTAPSVYHARIRWPAFGQVALFVLGVVLTIVFGACALSGSSASPQPAGPSPSPSH